MSVLGIIGGSGLDDPQPLNSREKIRIDTPYGSPSASLVRGILAGREVVLLSRHGRRHTIPPSQVNNRANLWALKEAGCSQVLATAACGSLRDEIGRGCLVIPDQFIDFARHRPVTFHDVFMPGIENARHTPMADPFDAEMRRILVNAALHLGFGVRNGGTILTIEGPRFSTRAESRMFKAWGADLVNMTIAPEAILANELGLAYAVIAVVTDFDSWKSDALPLRVEELIAVFRENVRNVTELIQHSVPSFSSTQEILKS